MHRSFGSFIASTLCLACARAPAPKQWTPPPTQISRQGHDTPPATKVEAVTVARIPKCDVETLRADEAAAYVACREGGVWVAPFDGEPTKVAQRSEFAPSLLAVHPLGVFFVPTLSDVAFLSRGGGPPTVVHHGSVVLAMQLVDSDLFVSLTGKGIVRIPLQGAPPLPAAAPQLVVTVAHARSLAVSGSSLAYVEWAPEGGHLVSFDRATSTSTDLGTFSASDMIGTRLLVAGNRVFFRDEIDLSSSMTRPLPQDCLHFVSDGRWVFGACSLRGVIGRAVAANDWVKISDAPPPRPRFAGGGTLAVTRNRICWAHAKAQETAIVCIDRPAELSE